MVRSKISETKRQEVFGMFDGRCAYCGCELDYDTFESDHFLAVALGGKIKGNLVPACPDCNKAKACLTIDEFRDRLSDNIINSFHGRLIQKYYGVKPQRIKFYFENVLMDK